MMKFNTPKMFGGSYEDALKNFSKAVLIYEKSGGNPPWGYAEALVWMGRTYEKLSEYQNALLSYKRALIVEPEYEWVKNYLLPSLEKRIKEEGL